VSIASFLNVTFQLPSGPIPPRTLRIPPLRVPSLQERGVRWKSWHCCGRRAEIKFQVVYRRPLSV
jgi:hypothetical protein